MSIFDLLTNMIAPKLNNIEMEVQKLKFNLQFKEGAQGSTEDNSLSYSQIAKSSANLNSAKAIFDRRQPARRGSVSSDGGSKRKKLEINPVTVITGSSSSGQLKGVEPKPRFPPRRHYFISRLSTEVNETNLVQYCQEKKMEPIACRELPSKRPDMKSFHIVFPETKVELIESEDAWPEHIILRRYFLNDEARKWIKDIGKPESHGSSG